MLSLAPVSRAEGHFCCKKAIPELSVMLESKVIRHSLNDRRNKNPRLPFLVVGSLLWWAGLWSSFAGVGDIDYVDAGGVCGISNVIESMHIRCIRI